MNFVLQFSSVSRQIQAPGQLCCCAHHTRMTVILLPAVLVLGTDGRRSCTIRQRGGHTGEKRSLHLRCDTAASGQFMSTMRLVHPWFPLMLSTCSHLAIYSNMTCAGAPSAATFPKGRGSVRRVVTLAAQLLLPINGLCSKLKLVPISLVSKAGSACVDALKAPSECAVLDLFWPFWPHAQLEIEIEH